jgi:hypothetical protein
MDGGELSLTQEELCNVAHRAYTQAYALGKNTQTVNYDDSQSKGEYVYIADVLGYEDGCAIVEMRNRFQKGDVLQSLSWDDTFQKDFTVIKIFDENGEEIDDAKRVQAHYKIPCPYPLVKGGYLRRKV